MCLPDRPRLNPALRRLWRHDASLQLGIEPRHAVVLAGLDAADLALLDRLDGTRDRAALEEWAHDHGVDADRVEQLLRLLARSGALEDGLADGAVPSVPSRHEPDLLALSLLHRTPGAAAAALRRRRTATVAVYGAGRVGATLAALLAAAGVGRLHCVDPAPVRPADLTPGGLPTLSAAGRGEAAAATVRGATTADATGAAPTGPVDLAVVAPASAAPPPEALTAVRAVPHLLVVVRETTASVGPLAVPGRTACVRCLQLARADRDPAWAGIAAQLAGSGRRVDACDVTLATLAASLAAAHALRWLDSLGATAPPSVSGVCEFDLVDARLRRRSLPPHPACGCMPDPEAGRMAG